MWRYEGDGRISDALLQKTATLIADHTRDHRRRASCFIMKQALKGWWTRAPNARLPALRCFDQAGIFLQGGAQNFLP